VPEASALAPRRSSTLYPSEAYVDVGGERRKAMADQLTTVTKRRLADRLGELSHSDL
jgi:mRNA interferase MazF